MLSWKVSKLFIPTATGLRQTCALSSLPEKFTKAQATLQRLTDGPDNAAKLKIYSLYKQATEGPCAKPKPGFTDFVGRAKWDAWSGLGKMTKEQAMEQYVDLVTSLGGKLDDAAASSRTAEPAVTDSAAGSKNALVSVSESGVFWFTLNRPTKKNALTTDMYEEWIRAFDNAAKDDRVKLMVVTAAGDYFSSGNDLAHFTDTKSGANMEQIVLDSKSLLRRLTGGLIDFPKPVVALVNGPAVGISASMLGLYDQVFASDTATFHMPYSSLGLTSEGCSSFTLPRLMGLQAASSLLLFNRKLTAQEAATCGLVTRVFPHANFLTEARAAVEEIATLPRQTLIYGKQLIREPLKTTLHTVNERECDRLHERWLSEDSLNAFAKFLSRKSKP